MKLRAAVCLNLSLNISESFRDFLSTCPSSEDFISPGIRDMSNFLGHPSMKLSSDMVTETFAPIIAVILYAYARDRASLTLRPNGKWNTSFWFPEGSMYSSTARLSLSGMNPATAFCSLKYDSMDRAEPALTSNSSEIAFIASSSGIPMRTDISFLNLAMSMDRSKLRGSISPAQDGTVGFLPLASFT